MEEFQETMFKLGKGIEFVQDQLLPAYREIEYITVHTEILFEDSDENIRTLNKVIKKGSKKQAVVTRNTIRSSCACVEGFSHILKSALQRTLDTTPDGVYSSKQLKFINSTFTNGSGADNYKESLKCFARKYNIDVSEVFGTCEFDKLKKVFEIRNRLMHPKEANDLDVSSEDTVLLSEAIVWFIDSHRMVFKRVLAHIEEKGDKLFLE
jgi:hypothetical protein